MSNIIQNTYANSGWIAFPLPAGEKNSPPVGVTGNRPASEARAVAEQAWTTAPDGANVGIRLPDNVIAIDVDTYKGKRGIDTITALEAELGPLAPTYMNTRREDPLTSGHRFYRVPDGAEVGDKTGPGVDILKAGHRYSVVWPSVVDGREYRWYAPDGTPLDGPPHVEDLPELPSAWVEYLQRGHRERAHVEDVPLGEAIEWLEAISLEPRAPGLAEISFDDEDGRNPALRRMALQLVNGAVSGNKGVLSDLGTLADAYREAVGSDRSEEQIDREITSAVGSAVALVRAEIEAGENRPVKELIEDTDWAEFADSINSGRWMSRPAAPGAGKKRKKKGLQMHSFEDIEVKEPSWLWEYDGVGGIPVGAVTIFTGKGEVGKSTACRWVAAQVTNGTLPGAWHGTPKSVLYIAAEESNESMVKPSLIAHGADMARMRWVSVDGEANTLGPDDMDELTELCLANDVAMVVVDPMSNFMHGADMHKASEVRERMRPWTHLAEAIDGSV